MDDFIYPNMWIKIEEISGEALVEISNQAEVQQLYLSKYYEQASQ